jgi:hypothetical protein
VPRLWGRYEVLEWDRTIANQAPPVPARVDADESSVDLLNCLSREIHVESDHRSTESGRLDRRGDDERPGAVRESVDEFSALGQEERPQCVGLGGGQG